MLDLLRSLYQPRADRFWRYVFAATFIALAGSLLLVSAAFWLRGGMPDGSEGPTVTASWLHFVGVVVFSPLVETWLLVHLLRWVQRFGTGPGIAALVGALTWGGLHGLLFPMWFFGTVWSFFVFSSAVLAWQQTSAKHAFWAAALPHVIINATVFGAAAAAGSP